MYSTFDWGIRDKDGYYFILGRTDDVINVAGHRLGTREIEEAVSTHPNIAEVAVVGVADQLKGQMPVAFAVVKDPSRCKQRSADDARRRSDGDGGQQLGAIGRPRAVHFVTLLPKTRSGKVLRRSIQALAEGRDPGDLTTIEDPQQRICKQITGLACGHRNERRRPCTDAGRLLRRSCRREAEARRNKWDRGDRDPRRRRPPAACSRAWTARRPPMPTIAVEKGRTAADLAPLERKSGRSASRTDAYRC